MTYQLVSEVTIPLHNVLFFLKEIVQYYTNNDSNAYCMLLDASKAFDHVHYIKLFNLLIESGICPVLTRFLLNLYITKKLCIK